MLDALNLLSIKASMHSCLPPGQLKSRQELELLQTGFRSSLLCLSGSLWPSLYAVVSKPKGGLLVMETDLCFATCHKSCNLCSSVDRSGLCRHGLKAVREKRPFHYDASAFRMTTLYIVLIEYSIKGGLFRSQNSSMLWKKRWKKAEWKHCAIWKPFRSCRHKKSWGQRTQFQL